MTGPEWLRVAQLVTPRGRRWSAAELWMQCLYRALAAHPEREPRCGELLHELMVVLSSLREKLELVPGEGWRPNPHLGDHAWAEAREREILAQIGEVLGVGPPPVTMGLGTSQTEVLGEG